MTSPKPPADKVEDRAPHGTPPQVDLGGLERHCNGLVYPRWARTWKNAQLFTLDGWHVWSGDIGRHQVHAHLKGKGVFFVLAQSQVWPVAERSSDWPAGTVERGWANPAYVRTVAVAKIIDGRWWWQGSYKEARYRHRRRWEEQSGQRARTRNGLPPLSCCAPDRLDPQDIACLLTIRETLTTADVDAAALFTTRLRFGSLPVVDDEELPRIRTLAKVLQLLEARFSRAALKDIICRPAALLGGRTMLELIQAGREAELLAVVERSRDWPATN